MCCPCLAAAHASCLMSPPACAFCSAGCAARSLEHGLLGPSCGPACCICGVSCDHQSALPLHDLLLKKKVPSLRGLCCRLRRQIERKRETLAKLEINAKVKEDLKTVALGTSKINYLDPRITVAWCKQHEVPIEKIFNKSLLSKFHWSMEIEPDFRF